MREVKSRLSALTWYMTNAYTAFYVYAGILAASLLTVGLFGILPLATDLVLKIRTLHEMDEINTRLSSNIETLKNTSDVLDQSRGSLDYLDRYMPQEVSVQDYMLEYISAAAMSGYSVKSFSQTGVTNGDTTQYDLNVNLEGVNYPSLLVENIEKLKRITSIEKFFMYKDSSVLGSTFGVNMTVRIYYYKGFE